MFVQFKVIEISSGDIGIFLNGSFLTETNDKSQVRSIIQMAVRTIAAFTGEDAIVTSIESNTQLNDFQDVEIVVS